MIFVKYAPLFTKICGNWFLTGLLHFVADKEAVSPDGDSTTAPPSQASEHSEVLSKTNSNNGRPHPIDAALNMHVNSKIKDLQGSEKLTNNHNDPISSHIHKKIDPTDTNFSSTSVNDEDDGTNNEIRDKLESPTGSYDSNNSNANNVPGQISSMDITRMKKVDNQNCIFLTSYCNDYSLIVC